MRSLKARIVGLVVGAASLATLVVGAVLWDAERDRTESQQRAALTRTLTLGQVALADELALGNFPEVRNYLSNLALYPEVRSAWLVGDDDRVIIDIARRVEGQSLAEVSPRAARLAARARAAAAGLIARGARHELLAVYPVGLQLRPGALRPDRVGLLVVVADFGATLAASKARLLRQVGVILGVTLVVALALLALLERSVSRPLERVLAVADEVAGGNLGARVEPVEGLEFTRIANALNDTLAQVEAQTQAIAESAYRLRRTNQLARVMSLDWDLERDEVVVAPELRQRLGMAADGAALDTAGLYALVHACDRPRFAEKLQACRGEGLPFVDEFRLVDIDGGTAWYQIRGDIEYARDGRPLRLLALAMDISERKQAETQQKALAAQLRVAQKLEAVGLLAGGIAHDFNNILTAILGFSKLAHRQLENKDAEAIRRYLDEVTTAGERGRDLIRQVLTFSQGESGTVAELSLHTIVGEVGRLLRPLLPAGVDLDVRSEPGLPMVLADPVLVQQIVMNLCVNARDAVDGGGHIVVSLALHDAVAETCASCRAPFAGRYVVLEVGDDGPGIPDEVVERIFDPFFSTKKVDGASGGNVSGNGSGSGLGLSVVHGSAHKLGGHIVLRSRPGEGALFAVYFPCPPADGEMAARGAPITA
ncbi:MAG: ATP-binding protein [Gammaproteobacteria bacterium]